MSASARSVRTSRISQTLQKLWSIPLVAAAAAIVATTQPFDNGPPIRSDGYGYHAWTYAILRGDLSFEGLPNDTRAFHESRPGYWWNFYPPGVALVRFPVMAIFAARSQPFGQPTVAEQFALAAMSVLALIITAALLLYVCHLAGAAPGPANIAILAVVFGTGLFHYSTYDASYSHVWSSLGLSALVALTARTHRRDGRIPAAALCVLAAWLMLVRNTNGFALVILAGVYLFLLRPQMGLSVQTAFRNVAWLGLGTFIGTCLQIAANTYAYGRFTVSSYPGELFVWDRPMQWSVLTSVAEHGLLPYYPITILLGLLPFAVRLLRPATLGFVALLLVYCTIYGYWFMWNLGASFGHRGFVEVLPLGAPLLAIALSRLAPWRRTAAVCVVVLCVYATLNLMAGYWRRTIPYHEIGLDAYCEHLVGRQQLVVVALPCL